MIKTHTVHGVGFETVEKPICRGRRLDGPPKKCCEFAGNSDKSLYFTAGASWAPPPTAFISDFFDTLKTHTVHGVGLFIKSVGKLAFIKPCVQTLFRQ